jgi:hypothetical protein
MGCKDKPQACSGKVGYENMSPVCEEINFVIFNEGEVCEDKQSRCVNQKRKLESKGKDPCGNLDVGYPGTQESIALESMETCGY